MIKAVLSVDHLFVDLTLTLPLPKDALFHKAGFSHATKVHLEEVKQSFSLPAPGKLSSKTEVVHYPSEETPFWIIFKYQLEEEAKQETPVEVKINLMDTLMGNIKK